MNTPLNDAWILEINSDLSIHWKTYPIPYDHGEVRYGILNKNVCN